MNASTALPGGVRALGGSTVTRFGYGAMQLAGPWVVGPPADHDGAVEVLRAAVRAGITHIDTSGAYGPHVTNELIREALHPPRPPPPPPAAPPPPPARAGPPPPRRPPPRRPGRLAHSSAARGPAPTGPGEPADPRRRGPGPGEHADG